MWTALPLASSLNTITRILTVVWGVTVEGSEYLTP